MMATSRACPKFKAEPSIIREALEEDAEDGFREIASCVKGMNPRQLKAMAGALLNEVVTRKNGFYMWQPVYIRFRGTANANYMSNFMTGRVVNADKNTVRIISDDGKTVLRYENTGHEGPSIYSVEAFAPIKEVMIEKGKRIDPSERETPKRLRPEDMKDVDFKLNSDGLNGLVSNVGKVVRSNKVARRARPNDNIMDLTKIAQSIESGTANYVEMSEETGEYELASHSYNSSAAKRKPKGRSKNGINEIELGDLEDGLED